MKKPVKKFDKQKEIDTLFKCFKEWFSDKYMLWLGQQMLPLEQSIKEIYYSEAYTNERKLQKIEQLKKKFFDDKSAFLIANLNEYFNVILDEYNDKLITKKIMKLRCNQISACIKLIESNDIYEKLT